MPVLRVVVSPDGDRWKLRHNFYSKWYATKREALQGAIDIAHAAAQAPRDAEVVLNDKAGPPVTVWIASRDSYPPAESIVGAP